MSNGGHENFRAQIFGEICGFIVNLWLIFGFRCVEKSCDDMCKWLIIAKRKIRGKRTQIRLIFQTISLNKRGQTWTLTIVHHHSHRQVGVLFTHHIHRLIPIKTCLIAKHMDSLTTVPLPLRLYQCLCHRCLYRSCPHSLYRPLCRHRKDRARMCYQGMLLPSCSNDSTWWTKNWDSYNQYRVHYKM